MKISISNASEYGEYSQETEITTLEELINLMIEIDCAVILSLDKDAMTFDLQIYDSWIE